MNTKAKNLIKDIALTVLKFLVPHVAERVKNGKIKEFAKNCKSKE